MTDIAGQIMRELERARRLLASLSDPEDRVTIERYIAELDSRVGSSAKPEVAF